MLVERSIRIVTAPATATRSVRMPNAARPLRRSVDHLARRRADQDHLRRVLVDVPAIEERGGELARALLVAGFLGGDEADAPRCRQPPLGEVGLDAAAERGRLRLRIGLAGRGRTTTPGYPTAAFSAVDIEKAKVQSGSSATSRTGSAFRARTSRLAVRPVSGTRPASGRVRRATGFPLAGRRARWRSRGSGLPRWR